MRVLFVGALLVGCHGTDITAPDGSIPSSDAVSETHTLEVAWNASPAIPGDVDSDLTITSATFQIKRLQAIGDAGGGSADHVMLGWGGGESGGPAPLLLPDAPTGIYSKVTLDVDGGSDQDIAWTIEGTARVNGNMKPFVIEDKNSIDIEVKDFSVTLPPIGIATLGIELDLENALQNVDFGDLDTEDGKLTLGTSDAQMPQFRSDLKKAFRRAGT